MKIAALALLVAGVASASVSDHSSEKASLKERSNLKDAKVGEVAAALKLLARERRHQSFLQNDFEVFANATRIEVRQSRFQVGWGCKE